MAVSNINFIEERCLVIGDARRPLITVQLCQDDDTPLDISGFTWAASVRSLEDDSEAGVFTVVPDTGTGEVSLELEEDALDSAEPGRRFIWDLRGTDSLGDTRRYVGGLVWLTRGATRV